jgi:hypothetical protein
MIGNGRELFPAVYFTKLFGDTEQVPGTTVLSRSLWHAVSSAPSIRRLEMKTLTTLTAVAALIVGVSIAAAQGSMGSSMDKGSGPPKTTGNAAFCINTSESGALNCKYASMAACEKDAQPQNLQCSPNPSKGTTGSKQ